MKVYDDSGLIYLQRSEFETDYYPKLDFYYYHPILINGIEMYIISYEGHPAPDSSASSADTNLKLYINYTTSTFPLIYDSETVFDVLFLLVINVKIRQ